uniref:Uncharacterized protein n=1 Tax=Lotharella globosa TaxID=91324 RepID=A0A7S3ZD81_9EUKA
MRRTTRKKGKKITTCPNAEAKFYDNVLDYLTACDEKAMGEVCDGVWEIAVVPNAQPSVEEKADEALAKDEFKDLPAMIKGKLKKTCVDKAMATAREQSKFDEKVQEQAFKTILKSMKENGAEIAE